jgi:hypothetical protein
MSQSYSTSGEETRRTGSAKVTAGRRAPRSDGRRKGLIGLGISFLILSGLCLASLVVSQLASPPPAPDVVGAFQGDPQSGWIVIDTGRDDACRHRIFDNASGRMVEVDAPCKKSDVGPDGKPVYRGTVDRLDRIQKSFQNR